MTRSLSAAMPGNVLRAAAGHFRELNALLNIRKSTEKLKERTHARQKVQTPRSGTLMKTARAYEVSVRLAAERCYRDVAAYGCALAMRVGGEESSTESVLDCA